MVDLIRNEGGGKCIGLEGEWGAGKSTIVRLMKAQLEAPDGNRDKEGHAGGDERDDWDFKVFVFDAWAHQGDPLRRTFLQDLIDDVNGWGWFRGDDLLWQNNKLALARRLRKEQTVSTPSLTRWGKCVVVALLLVPLGVALVSAGAKDGWVFWHPGVSWNSNLSWGVSLSLLPLVIVGLKLLARALRKAWAWLVRKLLRRKVRKDKPVEGDDVWALLTRSQTTSTESFTTEDPDPASPEFEDYFYDLMTAVLSDQERRLVIVLDNLDRVRADDACSIWATMQTFLGSTEHERPDWADSLWVLVPYDRDGIARLSNGERDKNRTVHRARDGDERTGEGTDEQPSQDQQRPGFTVADTFLDKSLQVRFEVPPPVLSDWNKYLVARLGDALPDHAAEEHMEVARVYRCFAGNASPTPRELKLFVNQIGALHRQWDDHSNPEANVPVSHMALYVLLHRSRTNRQIARGILDRTLPEIGRYRGEFAEDRLTESLAMVLYNAEWPKARQLLLGYDIQAALGKGDGERMRSLSDISGFWEVLDGPDLLQWVGKDGAAFLTVSKCLRDSGLFTEPHDDRHGRILSRLRAGSAAIESWGKTWNQQSALGSVAFLELLPERETASRVLQITSSTPMEEDPDAGILRPAAEAWAGGLSEILDCFDRLELAAVCEDSGVAVPNGVPGFLSVLGALHRRGSKEAHLVLLHIGGSSTDALSAMAAEVAGGQVKHPRDVSAHPACLRCLHAQFHDLDVQPLTDAMGARLRDSGCLPEEAGLLLANLWEVAADDFDQAQTLTTALNSEGYVLHHLWESHQTRDYTSLSWCLLHYLYESPDLGQPQVQFNASQGYDLVRSGFVGDGRSDITKAFANLLIEVEQIPLLFKVVAQSAGPFDSFVQDCLIWAASSEPISVGDQLADTDFDPSLLRFYVPMAKHMAELPPALEEWWRTGLNRIPSQQWIDSMTSDGEPTSFVLILHQKQARLNLGANLKEALLSAGKQSMEGSQVHNILRPHLPDLCAVLSPESRQEVLDGLLEASASRGQRFAADFFEHWGKVLSRDQTRLTDQFEEKAAPIVEGVVLAGGPLSALEWARDTIKSGPGLLNHLTRRPRMRGALTAFLRTKRQANVRAVMMELRTLLRETGGARSGSRV